MNENARKILICSLVCAMVENVVMSAGVIFCALKFEKVAILWFLLFPLVNSCTVKLKNGAEDNSETEK